MMRWIESLGILTFLALALSAVHAIGAGAPVQALALGLAALPVAYFCADFLTGIIHWICDSFGSATTPVWGPLLVGPFRRHHAAPRDITRISLAENLGASAIAGAAVMWLWSPEPTPDAGLATLFFMHLKLWVVVFAVLSNLLHRWSHWPPEKKPRWMVVLQRWHLILNTQEHLTHHHKPHRVNYCILCGWANPLSNRVPWQRLEKVLARLGIPTCFD
jgi:plasmanylethanolamine desaturase